MPTDSDSGHPAPPDRAGHPDHPAGPDAADPAAAAPRPDLTLPVLEGAPPAGMAPDEALPPDPLPFPDALMGEAIRAAARLWEPLAARAWEETARRGRGLLALRWEELRAAADALAAAEDAGTPTGDEAAVAEDGPPATWIPLTIVSRGDDFRGLLKQYDPHRQVMLLIAHEDGGEAVFGLECDGDRRPAPAECHARRLARTGPGPDGDGDAPASGAGR
jgi:hypothetical protein